MSLTSDLDFAYNMRLDAFMRPTGNMSKCKPSCGFPDSDHESRCQEISHVAHSPKRSEQVSSLSGQPTGGERDVPSSPSDVGAGATARGSAARAPSVIGPGTATADK